MSNPSNIPLSNSITEAAAANETPSIVVRSSGKPNDTFVELTNGTKLGLIQKVEWELSVTDYSRCVVTVIATPAEFKALAKNSTVKVQPAPDYHPLRYLWDWYATKVSLWLNRPKSNSSS